MPLFSSISYLWCPLMCFMYDAQWEVQSFPTLTTVEFNNCPIRCELFSLLHYCRQVYVFRVLTPIIRSWYSCNYSFWYWLTAIIVQQDVTVFSLLYICRQLYMLTPTIRSLYSCNYSFWYWLTAIIVQQDVTVFSLLYICRQFCMLTPIIRSLYSCNYSFWY